jgi:hypothetical protein
MTGNIALDVFIGLAFIYLLYSLYTTVIVEIIASIFRLRSRNLQRAIKLMLTDDEKSTIRKWFQGFVKIIKLKKWPKTNKQFFLGKFYNQPTIKYLSKPGFICKRTPSYIAPHSFSKAILDTLKNKGTGETLINKVSTGIDNCSIDENTRKHIKSLLEDANNDLQKFKLLLEQWFNDTMERSIGWFKRNNQLILFIIGLIIAVTFNVNTIHIAKLLSKDNKAREQMVAVAISEKDKYLDLISNVKDTTKDSDLLKKDYQKHIDTLNKVKNELKDDIKKTEIVFGGGWNLPEKITCKKKDSNITFKGCKRVFKDNSLNLSRNDIRGSIKKDKIFLDFSSHNYIIDTTIFRRSIKINYKGIFTFFFKKTRTIKTCRYKPWRYKITYACYNFWGYLLTALAISLGSPFWFDLLNKLVKLRGSARQAVTSESSSKSSGSTENPSNNAINRVG